MALSRSSTPLFVAGGLLAGGVIAAAALTSTGALASSPAQQTSAQQAASQPTPSPSRHPGPNGWRGPGRGMMGPGMGGFGHGPMGGSLLHGEFVVKTSSGTQTDLVQQGAVTANSGSTVTVRSSDGFTVTWTVGSSTSVRAGRAGSTVKDLLVGNTVTAMGPKTSGGGTATFIGERPTGRPGPATQQAPAQNTAPLA